MHEVEVPFVAVTPFVAMLLGIAILPLLAPHWWERNRNRAIFAGLVGVPTALYLVALDPRMLAHAGEEYLSFIVLLGSLYIVSGGIVLTGDLRTSPLTNAGLLTMGSVLASVIGTTGASMVLIRPFLRANRVRNVTWHLPLFFIFCVSNAGGLLTPLGDPPLFLGYLRGVPFRWTFQLLPEWLLVNGLLIVVFFLIDWRIFKMSGELAEFDRRPLGLAGRHNLFLLGAIVLSVALNLPFGVREGVMGAAAAASLLLTKRELREENGFTYHPIIEVMILFAGIFVTMPPALALLAHQGPAMGLSTPRDFFFASGILSSVLDNAPTYVTFFTIAKSLAAPDALTVGATGVPEALLRAISLGSVLMGANTYIGNGPNFMVKAICDEAGFKTPSFFGYMLRALLFLGPLWLLVSLML